MQKGCTLCKYYLHTVSALKLKNSLELRLNANFQCLSRSVVYIIVCDGLCGSNRGTALQYTDIKRCHMLTMYLLKQTDIYVFVVKTNIKCFRSSDQRKHYNIQRNARGKVDKNHEAKIERTSGIKL